MFGAFGLTDILFIMVLALLIFGPKRLPEIGRTLGKGLAEFRKASNELKRSLNAELALAEHDTPAAPYPARVPAETVAAPLGPAAAAVPAAGAAAPVLQDSSSLGETAPQAAALHAASSPPDVDPSPPYVPLQPYGAADPEPAATSPADTAAGTEHATTAAELAASPWPDPFGEPIGASPAPKPEGPFADPRPVEPR